MSVCHEGVGGIEADSVGRVGVGCLVRRVGFGGFRDAIPGGDSGGKGVESKRQHGGKVWRFETVGRNGGIGVDSSEERLGLEDIAGNGVGGVVELEERIKSGATKFVPFVAYHYDIFRNQEAINSLLDHMDFYTVVSGGVINSGHTQFSIDFVDEKIRINAEVP